MAHSYGGVVTMSLANGAGQDFMDRVKGIYFTDSVHYGLTKVSFLINNIDFSGFYIMYGNGISG